MSPVSFHHEGTKVTKDPELAQAFFGQSTPPEFE
jgi:hypothetical protein